MNRNWRVVHDNHAATLPVEPDLRSHGLHDGRAGFGTRHQRIERCRGHVCGLEVSYGPLAPLHQRRLVDGALVNEQILNLDHGVDLAFNIVSLLRCHLHLSQLEILN